MTEKRLITNSPQHFMTKVIHIKDVSRDWKTNPNYVYIGRAGKGNAGIFGNSHRVGRCSVCNVEHTQGEAVGAFAQDFEQRILEDSEFEQAVRGLRGKTLVCFCKTRPGIPCHGDVYVAFLEFLDEGSAL